MSTPGSDSSYPSFRGTNPGSESSFPSSPGGATHSTPESDSDYVLLSRTGAQDEPVNTTSSDEPYDPFSPLHFSELPQASAAEEQMHEQVQNLMPPILGPGVVMHIDCQSRSSELIMHQLSSFCTSSAMTLTWTRSDSQCWYNIGQGLYLVKVDSHRAMPAIDKACMLAVNEIRDSTATFMLELLTTLSPANTGRVPSLRLGLLDYFANLARLACGKDHPLSVVARELRTHTHPLSFFENVFSCLLEVLEETFGPEHDVVSTLQCRFTAFLRRSRKYDQARQVGKYAFVRAVELHGLGSLQARLAARQLKHIHVDTGSWLDALEVCFSIVGHDNEHDLPTGPVVNDKCSVDTMEDIARIYDVLGNDEKCISWLEYALTGSVSLGGNTVATNHMVDQLERSLRKQGRLAEVANWKSFASMSV